MTVVLILGAVWLFFILLVLALCGAAASADREMERQYRELFAHDRVPWAEAGADRRRRLAARRFQPERRMGPHDRRAA